MTSKPSIIAYVLGAGFLTLVAALVAMGIAQRGEAGSLLGAVVFVLAFSAIHVATTNVLVQHWLEYAAEEEPFTEDASAANDATASD